MNVERRALIMSVVGAIFFAGLGFGFFLLTDSEAVLLDGFFSLIGFVMGLLTIRVARLVKSPDDERFHFGYAAFEPLLNTVKGLIILAVCLFAAASAVGAILDGGRAIQAGWGVVYAVIATLGCFSLALVQVRVAKRTSSQLVAVDARTWMVDGIMSLVVTLAFGGTYLLAGTQWSYVVPFVDPGLVLVLTLMMLPVPLRIVGTAVGQLLKIAPDLTVQDQVRAGIQEVLDAADMSDHVVRMVRVGREFWVLVHVLTSADRDLGQTGELDTLRERLIHAIDEIEPGMVVDVMFTSRAEWA